MGVWAWAESGLLLLVTSLGLRLWPRHGARHFGVDSWFHMLSARAIRRGHRLPGTVPEFLIEGEWDYPPLFPVLLALVPEARLAQVERFVAPVIDSLIALVAFAFTGWATHSLWIALAAGALVAMNPVAVGESLTLTPRPLGALLLSLTLLLALAGRQTGDPRWLAGAAAASALVFLSHRMATQTLAFTSVVLAIVLGDPVLLMPLLAGAPLAFLLSGGFYRRVLGAHLGELSFWRRHLHERDDEAPLRPLGIARTQGEARPGFGPGWLRTVRLPFVLSPVLFPALLFPLSRGGQPWPPFAWEAWVWCICALGLCWLTTLAGPLRFLGHGHRYLVSASVPAGFLAALALAPAPSRPLFAALDVACLGVLALVLKSKQVDRREADQSLADLQEIARQLSRSPRPRVLCVPLGLASAVAYLARVPVLRHGAQAALERFSFFTPVVKRPIPEIAREYAISHLVWDSRIADAARAFPGCVPVWTGKRLQLLAAPPPRPGAGEASGLGLEETAVGDGRCAPAPEGWRDEAGLSPRPRPPDGHGGRSRIGLGEG